MIRSFRHRGLEKFLRTGSKAGIQPDHQTKLRRQLTAWVAANGPAEMGASGWDLHPLKGISAGYWSIKVNGNWRLTFRFKGEDAEVVDYLDYP